MRRPKTRFHKLLIAAMVFACQVPIVLYGHDIWLEADQFVLKKGGTLVLRQIIGPELKEVRANTGEKSASEELPFLWTMTPRFSLSHDKGTVNLLRELPNPRARAVVKPILERPLDVEGLALLAMEHSFVHHTMAPEEFREYLEHEKLTGKFGSSLGQRPAERERYGRALKSLVRIGDMSAGNLHGRILGQPVEIILLRNPYELNPGDSIDVKALFQGKPLANQRIVAHNRNPKGLVSTTAVYTDPGGVARLQLSEPGLWLVRLVHLTPCANDKSPSCVGTDWKSYWASYTFELD